MAAAEALRIAKDQLVRMDASYGKWYAEIGAADTVGNRGRMEYYSRTRAANESVISDLQKKVSVVGFQRINSKARVPTRATPGAAGFDLYAVKKGVIKARNRATIPLGLKFRIARGKYGRIASRSGLSARSGIEVGAGVIDSDYRQEVSVILYNHSSADMPYEKGHRIAQLIIETCDERATMQEEDIAETPRGGFASTGM